MHRISYLLFLVLPFLGSIFTECGKKTKTRTRVATSIARPSFNSDSAYAFIKTQVDLGPRIPGTAVHNEAVKFITSSLKRFGWDVSIEDGKMETFSGDSVVVLNIIARVNETMYRIEDDSLVKKWLLLCSHYDSRPWCDQEEVYEDRFSGLPAANDGASGVGVLLECARQISLMCNRGEKLSSPVEIVFFDVEDMGTPSFYTGTPKTNSWCLGSQMWASNHKKSPTKSYSSGILLDMVGGFNATFPIEQYSDMYAGSVVEKIWDIAKDLGYGSTFLSLYSNPILDDHYYVNKAGIPCVDIIHLDGYSETGFPFWWHTKEDNMEQISKSTLQAVGEVVMQYATK